MTVNAQAPIEGEGSDLTGGGSVAPRFADNGLGLQLLSEGRGQNFDTSLTRTAQLLAGASDLQIVGLERTRQFVGQGVGETTGVPQIFQGNDVRLDVDPSTHTVTTADTLENIARRHLPSGATREQIRNHVDAIRFANNLRANEKPQVGRELNLPGHNTDGATIIDRGNIRITTYRDGQFSVIDRNTNEGHGRDGFGRSFRAKILENGDKQATYLDNNDVLTVKPDGSYTLLRMNGSHERYDAATKTASGRTSYGLDYTGQINANQSQDITYSDGSTRHINKDQRTGSGFDVNSGRYTFTTNRDGAEVRRYENGRTTEVTVNHKGEFRELNSDKRTGRGISTGGRQFQFRQDAEGREVRTFADTGAIETVERDGTSRYVGKVPGQTEDRVIIRDSNGNRIVDRPQQEVDSSRSNVQLMAIESIADGVTSGNFEVVQEAIAQAFRNGGNEEVSKLLADFDKRIKEKHGEQAYFRWTQDGRHIDFERFIPPGRRATGGYSTPERQR